MSPEFDIQPIDYPSTCPEQLAKLALLGSNDALRILLGFNKEVRIGGVFVRCEVHGVSHMLPGAVFIFDRRGAL